MMDSQILHARAEYRATVEFLAYSNNMETRQQLLTRAEEEKDNHRYNAIIKETLKLGESARIIRESIAKRFLLKYSHML